MAVLLKLPWTSRLATRPVAGANAGGVELPVSAHPSGWTVSGVVRVPVFQRSTSTVLAEPLTMNEMRMSPVTRHGSGYPFEYARGTGSWLSSKDKDVLPLPAARVKARYRNP